METRGFPPRWHATIFPASEPASAGNEGPQAGTANHLSPWVTTVGASTQRREFSSTLTLTAIVFFVWWKYLSTERRLIAAHVPDEEIADVTKAYTPGTLLYGGATLLAFLSPWVSAALYLVIALFYALPLAEWRARVRRGR